MKTLFAVPWIEIEYGWGSRPEGYKVFDNLETCLEESLHDTITGNYENGYCGPERPLHYYETPDDIEGPFPKFVDILKFKSHLIMMK
jgi:hypothetical protein